MPFSWPNRRLTLVEIERLRAAVKAGIEPALLGNLDAHCRTYADVGYQPMLIETLKLAATRTMRTLLLTPHLPASVVIFQDSLEEVPSYSAVPVAEVEGWLNNYVSWLMIAINKGQLATHHLIQCSMRANIRSGYCVACGTSRALNWTLAPEPVVNDRLPMRESFRLTVNDAASPVFQAVSARVGQLAPPNEQWLQTVPIIAGICAKCPWACIDCGLGPVNAAGLVSMITDRVCHVCVSDKLTSVQPPKPNRRELRTFRKSISLKG